MSSKESKESTPKSPLTVHKVNRVRRRVRSNSASLSSSYRSRKTFINDTECTDDEVPPKRSTQDLLSTPVRLRRSAALRVAAQFNNSSGGSRSLNSSPMRDKQIGEDLKEVSMSVPNSPVSSPRNADNRPSSPLPRQGSSGLLNSPRRFLAKLFGSREDMNLSEEPIRPRKMIGHGGSARVFEAEVAGLILAAKIYHPIIPVTPRGQLCHSQDRNGIEYTQRLIEQKLDAIRALPEHPNLLSIFEYRFIQETRLVVLTELMDCTLRDLIDERRKQKGGSRFTKAEVLGLFEQVVKGVKYLHHPVQPCPISSGGSLVGIWHRDLKSENVMCKKIHSDLDSIFSDDLHCNVNPDQVQDQDQKDRDPINSRYILKIGDFDEAHIAYDLRDSSSPVRWHKDTEALSSTSTERRPSSPEAPHLEQCASGRRKGLFSSSRERLSLNIGTIQFMAPEMIFQQSSTYNEKVDIWSLGMVLYELLTLDLPYTQDPHMGLDLYEMIQKGKRPSLSSEIQEYYGASIIKIFNNCTELDPGKRPGAIELLRSIQKLQK